MKIEIKNLEFKEKVSRGAKAFEKIENLSIFLYVNLLYGKRVKGRISNRACKAISERIAIRILSAVALDEKGNDCGDLKFIALNNIYYVNFYNMGKYLALDILEIQNDTNLPMINILGKLSTNLLRPLLWSNFAIELLRVGDKEKKRKYGALVELTNKDQSKKVFISKKNNDYILTGIKNTYDIKIAFNEKVYHKREFKTKQAVRDILAHIDTSLQGLMYL